MTGIMPRHLIEKRYHHGGLTELIEVDGMHERKALMSDKAYGFIAIPGAIGTLEEVMEALTWLQLGLHHKPVAFLKVDGYCDHLLQMIWHMVATGFLRQAHFDMLLHEADPVALLDRMKTRGPIVVPPKI